MKHLSLAKWFSVVLVFSVFAAGSALGAEATTSSPQAVQWTWPLPPDPPRIQHLQTIITPQDLGVKKGFFSKLWAWIAGDDTVDRIVSPHGVAADSQGRIFVVDWGAGRVHFFDLEKKKYDQFGQTKLGMLRSPIGIALDAEGLVYVSDSVMRRIFVFNGTKNKRIIGDDSLLRPTGVAINQHDKILYVVDTGGHRIDAFTLDGAKLFSFGSHGAKPGQFNYPTHLTIDSSGDIYVMDSLNFRVQIFDKRGNYISHFGGPGTGINAFMKPKGIAVDNENHIWVSDGLRNSIQVFDRQGILLLIFGKLGIDAGSFNVPAGLYIDGKNRLIVADSYNYRVELFQYIPDHATHD